MGRRVCRHHADQCSLTALGNKTVTATFSHRLRVHVDGNGGGAVVSTPAGISCPGTCSATFAPGASVTLTAAPDAWSGITWTGDCSGSDPNGCAVTMDQPREVDGDVHRPRPRPRHDQAPGRPQRPGPWFGSTRPSTT